jgi:predicted acylesterase/phospholipase RssA
MTSLDIMQKLHFDLCGAQADILIQPAVGNFTARDFESSREIIALGRAAALDKVEKIKQVIGDFKS